VFKYHLAYLVCPDCHGDLEINKVSESADLQILTGSLTCLICQKNYPIIQGIPTFVPDQGYVTSFGLQWALHKKTQYDSYTKLGLSEKRFFDETRWPRNLAGQVILEVGCGAGRFTEHAASTGATVISMDYSSAVNVNYQANSEKPNLMIVQADVYHMPFRPGTFDKVFCLGVLQHTPDVHKAFLILAGVLNRGGSIVVDVYKKTWRTILSTKYYVRFLTSRMDSEMLYGIVIKWVNRLWPLALKISKMPRFGRLINWQLLIPDYSLLGLPEEIWKEWAYLDCFDMLSPQYDSPQTISTLRKWFCEAGLSEIEVCYGYNGIEGRGKKSMTDDPAK
jgi:ubiquinone/menaquinone biosynthesis C-methylase UbiE/uncharacterized protein YbaR (Trm112 family)